MRRRYSIWLKITAALLAPLLALAVAEGTVRLIGAKYSENRSSLPMWVMANIREKAFDPDPKLFWRAKKSSQWLSTNSFGFHGDEITPEKPAITYRILCLGDSITWGFPLDYHFAYPHILQERLNRLPLPFYFESLNAGVPGYTTLQGRRYLEELLFLKPDCITVMFGRNDQRYLLEEGGTMPDHLVPMLPGWVNLLRGFLGKSQLYGMMRAVLVERQQIPSSAGQPEPAAKEKAQQRVPPEHFRENLTAIIEAARLRGIAVVLITTARFPPFPPLYNGIVQELAEKYSLPLADAKTAFEAFGSRPLMVDDCHPNERGHRVIAQTLGEALLKQVIPGVAPADLLRFMSPGYSSLQLEGQPMACPAAIPR